MLAGATLVQSKQIQCCARCAGYLCRASRAQAIGKGASGCESVRSLAFNSSVARGAALWLTATAMLALTVMAVDLCFPRRGIEDLVAGAYRVPS